MESLSEKTVRDLACSHPSAPRIFRKFGIDYGRAGEKTLAQACSTAPSQFVALT